MFLSGNDKGRNEHANAYETQPRRGHRRARRHRFRLDLLRRYGDRDPALGQLHDPHRSEIFCQQRETKWLQNQQFQEAILRILPNPHCQLTIALTLQNGQLTITEPLYIRLQSGKSFGMAGLYEVGHSPEGEEVTSCAIVTTEANDLMKTIHERMPVIIPKENEDLWLDPKVQDRTFSKKLARATGEDFQITTDGFAPYRDAIVSNLEHKGIDFAQLTKSLRGSA
jgi:SOS response associated peptidase (SRAP)